MTKTKLKTKVDVDFLLNILSVLEKFEHQGKKYLPYLNTRRKSDEAAVYEKIIIPLFTDVLGYDKHKDFNPQATLYTGIIDNWIRSREGTPLIALEALRSNATQNEFVEHRQRLLGGYFDELGTKYAVLTNGVVFEVWNRIAEKSKGLYLKINFQKLYSKFVKGGIKSFTDDDCKKITVLMVLKKNYQHLDVESIYLEPELDISEELHFNNFLTALQERMENVNRDALVRFEYLQKEYQECKELIEQYKEKAFLTVRRRYKKAHKLIKSFETWQKTSPINTTAEAFCMEAMYVLFNRILLIRICEDKGIIQRKISNGGIKKYIEYRGYIKFSEVDYKVLLKEAYQIMDQFYPHLFRIDIFDWYEIDNDLLLHVLFTFNPYNFGNVDRDILGKLYEKYLNREKRKKLGEFYTPEIIIDYILKSVGYRINTEIDGKILLDPACGSGGFLVRATNILVSRLKERGFDTETILNKVRENIYGLEVNPFACHLAETNLLFQVIDLIKEARENNPEFIFERFYIFQTDTLRSPEDRETKLFEELNSYWLEDAEIVKMMKLKKDRFDKGFDYVVGNPPYVTVCGINAETKEYLRKYYKSAKGRFNLFTIFIERGIQFLSANGHLGYVIPQGLLTHNEYQYIRKYILDTCSIDNVHILPYGIFESSVDTLVMIMRFEIDIEQRMNHEVKVSFEKGSNYSLNQEKFYNNPLKQFEIFITSDVEIIFKKMQETSVKLDELVEIQQGIIYTGRPKSEVFSNEQKNPKFKPVLDGRDIGRYELKWHMKERNRYIEYSQNLHRPRDERLFIAHEKLIMPRKSTKIIAMYDNEQFYALNTVYILVPKSRKCMPKYILALLNSKLFTWYYQKKWVGWQVVIPALKEMPVKIPSFDIQEVIVQLVDKVIDINKELPNYEKKAENLELLLDDQQFVIGDLADISGVKLEIKEHIGKPKIKVEGYRVKIDSKSIIVCENEYLTKYIALYLLSKHDNLRGMSKADIVKFVRIPKTIKHVKQVLAQRNTVVETIQDLKKRREDYDKEIDTKVFEIYMLNSDEKRFIEGD